MLNSGEVLSALSDFELIEFPGTSNILSDTETILDDYIGIERIRIGVVKDWAVLGHYFLAGLGYTNPRKSHYMVDSAFSLVASNPETAQMLAKPIKELLLLCGITIDYSSAFEADAVVSNLEFCPDAEPKFIDALAQVNKLEPDTHEKISVYHDEFNNPVALRKMELESSALLLNDVILDGIPLPAGSLAALPRCTKAKQTGEIHYGNGKRRQMFATYDLSDAPYLSPGRLSPWVHESAIERAIFGVSDSCQAGKKIYDSWRGSRYAELTLDDFRSAADRILSLAQA